MLVGGCLLALLFAADRYLPRPVDRVSAADVDRSIIRIRSARIGPEKVEFDTSHPPQTAPTIEAERHDEAPRQSYAMMPQPTVRPAPPAPATQQADRARSTHVRHRVRRPQERLFALDHAPFPTW